MVLGTKSSKNYLFGTLNWFSILLIIAIILGVGFRFIELDRKTYWHDEVYTSMRAAGFTRAEIDDRILQNKIILSQDLQQFQEIKPGSNLTDTLQSLAVEDPQHPPLYFTLARFWLQIFGSSLTASRILPAIISLFYLPIMYYLARELFGLNQVALLATALLALSPFDILFAQTARQYSFLTLTTLLSSLCLIKAMSSHQLKMWIFYTLSVALGLYIHPFACVTMIAHGALIMTDWLWLKSPFLSRKSYLLSRWSNLRQNVLPFGLAMGGSLILYIPWLWVLITNFQRASATTDWTRYGVEFIYLVKLWILSFSSLFFDLDFGFDNLGNYLARLPFLLLSLWGVFLICRHCKIESKLFIITTIFVPFICLALPDLIVGGKRSAVSRYLIPCYPGLQLALAYAIWFLIFHFNQRIKWLGKGVISLVLTASIISNIISAFSDTWWCKDLSYFNPETARIINQNPDVIVVSDIGDDYTNTGDLISLSYLMRPDVKLLLLSKPPKLDKNLLGQSHILIFRPSQQIRLTVNQLFGPIEPVKGSNQLWQLINRH
jgi:uncharacterized membrane protein